MKDMGFNSKRRRHSAKPVSARGARIVAPVPSHGSVVRIDTRGPIPAGGLDA